MLLRCLALLTLLADARHSEDQTSDSILSPENLLEELSSVGLPQLNLDATSYNLLQTQDGPTIGIEYECPGGTRGVLSPATISAFFATTQCTTPPTPRSPPGKLLRSLVKGGGEVLAENSYVFGEITEKVQLTTDEQLFLGCKMHESTYGQPRNEITKVKKPDSVIEMKAGPIRCTVKQDLKDGLDNLKAILAVLNTRGALRGPVNTFFGKGTALPAGILVKSTSTNQCRRGGVQVTFSQPITRALEDRAYGGSNTIENFFKFFSGDDTSKYNPNDKTKNAVNMRLLVGKLSDYFTDSGLDKYRVVGDYPKQRTFKFSEMDPLRGYNADGNNELIVFMEARKKGTGHDLIAAVETYLDSPSASARDSALDDIVTYCTSKLAFDKATPAPTAAPG